MLKKNKIKNILKIKRLKIIENYSNSQKYIVTNQKDFYKRLQSSYLDQSGNSSGKETKLKETDFFQIYRGKLLKGKGWPSMQIVHLHHM